MKKIKAFPDIDIRTLARRVSDNPILDSADFYCYASGRAAVYFMAKAISGGQRRTAYLPAFHCGVEVEAFVRAGFEVKFYPLRDNLEADLNKASEYEISPGDVFFVIHYFGFSQPMESIADFCRQHQLILVEDCAHGLYSRNGQRLLGTYGDWAIFSMRKTLALPNGGGVLKNSPSFPRPAIGKRHFNPALVKSSIRSILDYEINAGSIVGIPAGLLLRTYSRFAGFSSCSVAGGKSTRDEPDLSFYEDNRFGYDLDISKISRLFLQPMSVTDIVNRRRENYRVLSHRLRHRSDLEPVFPELKDGVCPLCFPVWVAHSDWWMTELIRKGIEGFVFGRHHHPFLCEREADSVEKMRTGILGLPVHHNLSEEDIEELAHRIEDISN